MADKRKLVLSIYLLPLCIGLVFAQSQVIVEPTVATVRDGQNVTLLCRGRNPLLYCRFEFPGMESAIRVSERGGNNYVYYGNGFQSGDCGLQLYRTDLRNNGKVKCFLGYAEEEDTGLIDLVVGVEPAPPHFESFNSQPITKGNKFEDRCIVENGRPGANISFYLDNEEIVNGVSNPEEYNQNGVVNVVRRIAFTIEDFHNGKTLTCRSEHFAYPGGMKEVSAHLRVNYAPVPEPVKTIYGLQLERTAFVTVTIQSNPQPNTHWSIDNKVHMSEGESKERYEAQAPREVGEGKWNVTLVIDKLTLEDTTKSYKLIADNALGRQEYMIKISPSDAPVADLDMGAIIGIAVACILVIVVLGLLIAARATGRWCFAENSNAASSNINGREGVDEAMLPELLPRRHSSTWDENNAPHDGTSISDSGNNDERKPKLSYIQKEKKSNKRSRPLTKEK
ncbi:fasciclin-3 isoform X2 [Culicoides brevitarsis]|uniref:fasciclin-3 isoform X2 n=1 Tax=Culicoides brevitarsis TaxID=469753 RepID=UPI00307B5BED